MAVRQARVKNRAKMSNNLDNMPNLAEKVFGIDLIREMILNLAIRGRKGQVCGSNVSSLRLVQKSWLDSITKVLQKSKEPLFRLVLDEDNSLQESVGEDGKLLDRFLNAVSTKPSLPTFSVKILDDVFVPETHSSLSKLLVHFGAGLVQLDLHIPSGCILKFMFPNFTLPSLRKLSVQLTPLEFPEWERNINVSHFINSLLNAAPGLTDFAIPISSCHDDDDPLAFEFFTLPPSITTLELACKMSSQNLKLLSKIDLPKLTSLTLLIPPDEAYPDGLLFRILDKCRKTLRRLMLLGQKAREGSPRFVTNFRFPVMEKLGSFSNGSINLELEPGITSLERFLPKLSSLVLVSQTPDMFRKWTENSNFKSRCRTLLLRLANENVRPGHPDYWVGVNLEMIRSIHVAFPNVRTLNLTVSGTQVCGLKYLFLEMKTLRDLLITAVGSMIGLDRNFWDALLIGVPIEVVKGFRRSADFSEDGQLTNPSAPTIKNLQALKYLTLETDRNCLHVPLTTEPLISDLTFLLALLKMPKLKYLTFKGKFQASDEMAERWRSQGRKLLTD